MDRFKAQIAIGLQKAKSELERFRANGSSNSLGMKTPEEKRLEDKISLYESNNPSRVNEIKKTLQDDGISDMSTEDFSNGEYEQMGEIVLQNWIISSDPYPKVMIFRHLDTNDFFQASHKHMVFRKAPATIAGEVVEYGPWFRLIS